jgi:DHA1 family bicyclomycin/chloramphenicol resistance-like MFS transporter
MNFSSLLRASGTLLRHREFVLLTSIGSIGLASFFVFIASAPFVYAEQYELSPARFSITFAINALGFFAASQFAAPLGERFGLDLLISSAALGFAVLNSILFVLVYLEFDSLVIVVGTLFLANTFLGVIIPTTMVMALEDQGEIAGLASSLSGAIQWLAGGLVIAIAGPFFDGTVLPMVASIAICALVVVYLSVFVARSPERQH